MLGGFEMMSMAATASPEKAQAFYEGVLGLTLQEDTPFALVFAAGDATLRLQKVPQFTPQPFSALAWKVPDMQATVHGLAAKGVIFERFSFLQQDDAGIWTAPDGTQVAWFKDPEGNLLSLARFS